MFSFDMTDSERIEVCVTCFNSNADLHYQYIQLGNIYMLSRGTIKTSNKFYNKLNSDIEITLTDDSEQSLADDDLLIPNLQFSFTPFVAIHA